MRGDDDLGVRLTLAALALIALPVAAGAQIISDLTPDLIDQAIKEGQRKPKGGLTSSPSRVPGRYYLSDFCYLTTPYSRVVHASFRAFSEYKPFSSADVTDKITAPEVEIRCRPRNLWRRAKQGVRAVALTAKGGRDPIPPRRTIESNGERDERGTVTAIYPISAITEDRELHVVFAGSDDVKLRLNLKNIR